jgi:hypothetical protein
MIKRLSWLNAAPLLVLCALTASAVTLARTTGYLPGLGPAPLRFRSPTPAVIPAPLPPLRPAAKEDSKPRMQSTNVTSEVLTPDESPLDKTLGKSLRHGSEYLSSGEMVGPMLPPVTAQNESAGTAALSPESVLGYLMPLPTNAPAGALMAPIFVPPPPPRPPDSRATYESR